MKRLDAVKDRQNVGPYLGLNCLQKLLLARKELINIENASMIQGFSQTFFKSFYICCSLVRVFETKMASCVNVTCIFYSFVLACQCNAYFNLLCVDFLHVSLFYISKMLLLLQNIIISIH